MIHHSDDWLTIHQGDCVEVMRELPAESVDAVVTDPPYDLLTTSRNGSRRINNPDNPAGRTAKGFMGKTWDGTGVAFRAEMWREAFRVAKPGAHLLAFGGTRTYHRLAGAIEDAGWEIRDCLVWAYANGFPKSLNFPDGAGTALKPAWEPIVMARKPLIGTVAANRERHGTGALNIGATRIGYDATELAEEAGREAAPADGKGWWPANEAGLRGVHTPPAARKGKVRFDAVQRQHVDSGTYVGCAKPGDEVQMFKPEGRWPANLLLTDPIFDGGGPGVVGGGAQDSGNGHQLNRGGLGYGSTADGNVDEVVGGSGTYSRFFLVPKSSRSDREPIVYPDGHEKGKRFSTHPTQKPTELMRHLVRLVTPPGGTVLDCFLGSGTTAIAANAEGFRCIGIEKEQEYLEIAVARLAHQPLGLGLDVAAPVRKRSGRERESTGWKGDPPTGSLDLLTRVRPTDLDDYMAEEQRRVALKMPLEAALADAFPDDDEVPI